MRKWCDSIALKHCSINGIRKAGATIAAVNAAFERELMATFGWESPKQAAIYMKTANWRRVTPFGVAKIALSKGEQNCPGVRGCGNPAGQQGRKP